jgi:predicted ATPase
VVELFGGLYLFVGGSVGGLEESVKVIKGVAFFLSEFLERLVLEKSLVFAKGYQSWGLSLRN